MCVCVCSRVYEPQLLAGASRDKEGVDPATAEAMGEEVMKKMMSQFEAMGEKVRQCVRACVAGS